MYVCMYICIMYILEKHRKEIGGWKIVVLSFQDLRFIGPFSHWLFRVLFVRVFPNKWCQHSNSIRWLENSK